MRGLGLTTERWSCSACTKSSRCGAFFCCWHLLYVAIYFFFSSRRRHTRFDCDWSSDVCSSDLTRVSLGAQSFQPRLLSMLERGAGPDDVRRAVYALRDVGFDNISLDLVYGIPSKSPADLDADLSEALALEPEHLSCYELEAKRGTRFTHAHGAELARQAEAMESYFERVVARAMGAGFRWYETANFCRLPQLADGRDLRSRHNLAYWRSRDYLGLGIGAVSTIHGRRWRTTPRLGAYLAALAAGERPPREGEELSAPVRRAGRGAPRPPPGGTPGPRPRARRGGGWAAPGRRRGGPRPPRGPPPPRGRPPPPAR